MSVNTVQSSDLGVTYDQYEDWAMDYNGRTATFAVSGAKVEAGSLTILVNGEHCARIEGDVYLTARRGRPLSVNGFVYRDAAGSPWTTAEITREDSQRGLRRKTDVHKPEVTSFRDWDRECAPTHRAHVVALVEDMANRVITDDITTVVRDHREDQELARLDRDIEDAEAAATAAREARAEFVASRRRRG